MSHVDISAAAVEWLALQIEATWPEPNIRDKDCAAYGPRYIAHRAAATLRELSKARDFWVSTSTMLARRLHIDGTTDGDVADLIEDTEEVVAKEPAP